MGSGGKIGPPQDSGQIAATAYLNGLHKDNDTIKH